MTLWRRWLPSWRREALRTTLWLVPALMVVLIVVLFAVTYLLERAVYFAAAMQAIEAKGHDGSLTHALRPPPTI